MKILLVGAGGYGTGYVKELLKCNGNGLILEGIVEPYLDSCDMKNEILSASIPVYKNMDEFYSEHEADLAIICTPPFLHCQQSILALSKGSYVLCEKPISPTVADAKAMLEAEQTYGKWIAIGYQWSFSEAMQEFKKDILAGKLGAPISFKTAISWPRNRAYYNRGNGWGGRISKDGIMILDSIASNACAHYLHNMFFVLGKTMDTSAEVESFTAECLRANAIENFDTCSIKLKANGVPLYFIASHAAEKNKNPEFEYKFENATVTFSQSEGSEIKALFSDGTEKSYGDPFKNGFQKIHDCIDAIQQGTAPICRVKTALPHTIFIEEMYRKSQIVDFPSDLIGNDEKRNAVFVKGLFDSLYKAYEEEAMLSEIMKF